MLYPLLPLGIISSGQREEYICLIVRSECGLGQVGRTDNGKAFAFLLFPENCLRMKSANPVSNHELRFPLRRQPPHRRFAGSLPRDAKIPAYDDAKTAALGVQLQ